MLLKEIREAFEAGTSSANAINRQLIFSGIAIVWILKGNNNTSLANMPDLLLWVLGLLALSLTLDLFQALVHTGVWYFQYRSFKNNALTEKENKNGIDESQIIIKEEESSSIATWILWLLKIFITIAAYTLLIIHLVKSIV